MAALTSGLQGVYGPTTTGPPRQEGHRHVDQHLRRVQPSRMTVATTNGESALGSRANSESTVLQTLLRGLSVLDAVAERNGTATAKSLARQLGLS